MHIDDVVVTRNSGKFIEDLINKFNKAFTFNDLGKLHYFLGDGIFLIQTKYMKDLLMRRRMFYSPILQLQS